RGVNLNDRLDGPAFLDFERPVEARHNPFAHGAVETKRVAEGEASHADAESLRIANRDRYEIFGRGVNLEDYDIVDRIGADRGRRVRLAVEQRDLDLLGALHHV